MLMKFIWAFKNFQCSENYLLNAAFQSHDPISLRNRPLAISLVHFAHLTDVLISPGLAGGLHVAVIGAVVLRGHRMGAHREFIATFCIYQSLQKINEINNTVILI